MVFYHTFVILRLCVVVILRFRKKPKYLYLNFEILRYFGLKSPQYDKEFLSIIANGVYALCGNLAKMLKIQNIFIIARLTK